MSASRASYGAARTLRPLRTAVAALAAAAAAAGCGLGAGDTPSGVRLTVSEGFGAEPVKQVERPEASGDETVMRLLQRNARVQTRYGGGFVQSIDGRRGDSGASRDWFFYVNGVESEKGAAAVRLHDGDRIWWDLHAWSTAMRVPAVVGSFPEPFVHGIEGKRLPVRVECTQARGRACLTVSRRLAGLGVVAARGGLQRSLTKDTLRVVVGRWEQVRSDETARLLEDGPQASGVFARPARDGRSIAALDENGAVTRILRAGAGLVAATRLRDNRPVWVVSGTDDAGVEEAAQVLAETVLANRFAVAAVDGLVLGLPDAGRSGSSG